MFIFICSVYNTLIDLYLNTVERISQIFRNSEKISGPSQFGINPINFKSKVGFCIVKLEYHCNLQTFCHQSKISWS